MITSQWVVRSNLVSGAIENHFELLNNKWTTFDRRDKIFWKGIKMIEVNFAKLKRTVYKFVLIVPLWHEYLGRD